MTATTCDDRRCQTRACTACKEGIHSMCKSRIDCWHTGRAHPCRCEGPGGGVPGEAPAGGSEAGRAPVRRPFSPPCGIRHPANVGSVHFVGMWDSGVPAERIVAAAREALESMGIEIPGEAAS